MDFLFLVRLALYKKKYYSRLPYSQQNLDQHIQRVPKDSRIL